MPELAPPLNLLREYRARVIEEGIADVERTYARGDFRRAGAFEGFELCRGLEDLRGFARVLAARTRRERKMLRRMNGADGGEMEGQLAAYWRHRWATLQVEFVLHRLEVMALLLGFPGGA